MRTASVRAEMVMPEGREKGSVWKKKRAKKDRGVERKSGKE